MYEERFYRNAVFSKFSLEISHKESDLFISTNTKIDKELTLRILRKYYQEIEDYIKATPLFLTSLSPLEHDEAAPPIVKEMIESSHSTKIGPFSSVSGAIAQYVGKDLLNYTDEVIVENGGDIFLKINEDKRVGVYLGEKFQVANLLLRIKRRDNSFGIASSSSCIGHSLNFGQADLVTIVAHDPIIADGFATSLSNRIKKQKDAKETLAMAKKDPLIEGLLIALEGKIFLWGQIEIDNENSL
ncbi:MAG: UPF0280 family protein [Candidatus Omnitrophica bacterium]|nr:UPF0280 family protein [Candidatus Omnitrophota bacterium]MBU0896659.1 UPF0280 family protein [Candidatus Omnitrophota bacterium]MBU1809835.1 UPF0280 family protein [Candidatus Omnitrophota bacterium]